MDQRTQPTSTHPIRIGTCLIPLDTFRNALIEAHGTEAVEQHMATVRAGRRSTTMLADVPVTEQLMIAKMVCDVIAASKS